ncbi:MAG TPA: LytR C-terminal domain-containing protein [Actinomycetota bacterium]|nr:LytR C-terminal domain-containing protein [Actinomycetota bacterium]
MQPANQKARNIASALGVVILALSPFLVYFMTRGDAAGSDQPPATRQSVAPSPSPSPIPSPSPSPSPAPIDRAQIKVEVLNAGAPSGSGKKTGDLLTSKGFTVSKVGDTERNVTGYLVYYKTDQRMAQEVATELGANATVEALPADLKTNFDVLVLVGAGSQPSPSPTPRRSPSPTPRA